MLYHKYYSEVCRVLDGVMRTQGEAIERAGAAVAESIARGGMVFVFGCGHSHIIGEDLFYRAGGLAPVCAMLDPDLMLHAGAVKSSCMEKMPGLARPVLEQYSPTPDDVVLVVSTSGINAVPVEMAQCARQRGIPVIAIASSAYDAEPSRAPDGKHLHECADIVIDNGVCHGDAAVEVGENGVRVGPVSTLSSCLIAQCIMIRAEELLWEQGVVPPVYVSGNISGGMQKNERLIEQYRSRIRCL
jgi:uncharacterized phosphosugar-binding protein